MAVYTVTTFLDEAFDGTETTGAPDGTGLSLREAIGLAANNADNDDTITFATSILTEDFNPGVAGADTAVIRLVGGGPGAALDVDLPAATDTLTIDGDINDDGTPDIIITGDGDNDDDTIAAVSFGDSTFTNVITEAISNTNVGDNANHVIKLDQGDLTLDGLVITGGVADGGGIDGFGGGIYVNAGNALTAQNSLISGNSASYFGGGLNNSGTATLTNSTLSGNSAGIYGGGLSNLGTATLTNSTLSGNRANRGGGLANYGTAALTNSTLTGNFADDNGGGLFNDGTATLTNSTVSGNGANNNGAGLRTNFAATTNLNNTIVLGNANAGGADEISGPYVANSSITSGNPADVFDATTNDPAGALLSSLPGGVMAGVLANNGGAVETIALKADTANPAIDVGDATKLDEAVVNLDLNGDGDKTDNLAAAPFTDAAGQARQFDFPGVGTTSLDLGAVEAFPNTAPVANDDAFMPAGLTEDSGATFVGDVRANDTDGEDATTALAVTAFTDQPGVGGGLFSVDAAGALTFNPNGAFESLAAGDMATSTISYKLTDAGGLTDTADATVTIQGVNDAPVAAGTIADQSGIVGAAFSFMPPAVTTLFTDVDAGDVLSFDTFAATGLPTGLTLNPSTGEITGTPTATGTGTVTVTGQDKAGLFDTLTFDVVIGAAPEAPSLIVTTDQDVIDKFDGLTSLREAIGFVNDGTFGSGSTITFATSILTEDFNPGVAGADTAVIRLVGGGPGATLDVDLPAATDTLTIDGDINDDGTPDIIITGDGDNDDDTIAAVSFGDSTFTNVITDALGNTDDKADNANHVVKLDQGDLTLDGLVITGGVADGAGFNDRRGGGIHVTSFETFTLENSLIAGNASDLQAGGAFISYITTATLTNTTVSGNFTGELGGGLYNSGTVMLTNSTVSGNISNRFAGGLASGYTATLTNSTVSGNSASYSGGGLNNTGTVSLTNSTVSGNSAGTDGGGLFNSGTATLTNSTLSGNYADDNGGGLYNRGAATLTNSTLSGNSAGDDGGGLYNDGTAALTNSTLSGNSAGTNGGGLYNDGTATVIGGALTGNSASSGGGGLSNGGIATLTNTTLNGNSAYDGGGLFNSRAATLTNTTVSGNSANNYGGGLWNLGAASLTNSTLSGNSAGGVGGGLSNFRVATLMNSTVSGNSAGTYGGGVYTAPADTTTLANTIVLGNAAAISDDETSTYGSGQTLIAETSIVGTELIAAGGMVGSGLDLGGTASDVAHAVFFDVTDTIDRSAFSLPNITFTDARAGVLAANGGAVDTILIVRNGFAEDAGVDNASLNVDLDETNGTGGTADDLDFNNDGDKIDTSVTKLFEAAFGADINLDGDATDILDSIDEFPFDARSDARNQNGVDLGAVELTAAEAAMALGTIELAGPASAAEGDAGATTLTFTLNRTGNTDGAGRIAFTVTGSGANPADGSDFDGGVLPTGFVTFDDGDATATLDILLTGDTTIEPDETFTVTISDADGNASLGATLTAFGTITDNDAAPNTAPVAKDDAFMPAGLTEDSGATFVGDVRANDTDGEDATTALAVTAFTDQAGVGGGLFSVDAAGALTFNPNGAFESLGAGATTTSSITYKLTDTGGLTDTADATVTIQGVNDAPMAAGTIADQSGTVGAAFSFTPPAVTTLFTDVDAGDVLSFDTFAATGLPAGLTLNPSTGEVAGTPTATGTGTVTVTGQDKAGLFDTLTFDVVIGAGPNTAPVANDDAFMPVALTEDSGATVVGDVRANDVDGEDATTALAVTAITDQAGVGGGLFSVDAAGALTFNPNGAFESLAAGDMATSTITYKLTDTAGLTDTADATVTIQGVNDPPLVNAPQAFFVAENRTLVGGVGAIDPDQGDFASLRIAGGPDAAAFDLDSFFGELRFRRNPDFEQPADADRDNVYELDLVASDGFGDGPVQSITVTVTDIAEGGGSERPPSFVPDTSNPTDADNRRVNIFVFDNLVSGGSFLTADPDEAAAVAESPIFDPDAPDFAALSESLGGAVPIFRFFNSLAGVHFYTASEAERDAILADIPKFTFEGEAFFAFTEPFDGAIPVERFFNPETGVHAFAVGDAADARDADPAFIFEADAFYGFPAEPPAMVEAALFDNMATGGAFLTVDPAEREAALASGAFEAEGAIAVGPANAPTGLGLSPVYRFFNPATGAHIFTLDHGERDGLLQPGSGFAYEGVGFSAYASGGGDRDPVFRLFDPTTGIHIFTADPADRDAALAAGAFDEGVAFYGA